MKEYFNSLDDIQFFHTFSSISPDVKIVTLNEIHRYIQNFMLYKMIYFSSHKFAFSNLRFSSFYEHFRQLREKYEFKLKIKYIMLISSLMRIWWCTYIWLFLKKTTPLHSTHSTKLFKIFFSLLTLSTAFSQKASVLGKNCVNIIFSLKIRAYQCNKIIVLFAKSCETNFKSYGNSEYSTI